MRTRVARRLRRGNGVLDAPPGAWVWGIVGMAVTTALGFIVMAFPEWSQSTFALDEFLYSLNSPFQEWVAFRLQAIDEPVIVAIILLGMGVIVTLWRGWLPAFGSMVVAGIGWLLIAGVKLVVAEPRPQSFFPELQEQALSYPSGHVTFVMALTVAVAAVFAGSRWRWPLVIFLCLLTLLTAWSRLLLGVHYPMDIVGGLLGGLSGAMLVLGLWNALIGRVTRSR